LGTGDPWQEAIEIASGLRCAALVIDTENAAQPLHRSLKLAEALRGKYVALENLEESELVAIAPSSLAADKLIQ
jgi:magnesium chelatase subunit D